MSTCPTCYDEFDTDRGLSIHHKLEHGESLIEEHSKCLVEGCYNEFTYYPSEKEGILCPECVESGKSIFHTEEYTDEIIQGTEPEYVEITCKWCGDTETVMKSKSYTFCSRSCLDDYNSERISGEDNPRYVDGNSSGKKYKRPWPDVRESVLHRDRCCVICGKRNNLIGHHIKPVRTFENERDAHYEENAVIVCSSCHPSVEHGKVEIPESVINRNNLEEQSDSL